MGYRANLQIYLHESKLDSDEKRYYEAYQNCNWDSIEAQEKLLDLSKELKHVWNEFFEESSMPFPSCHSLEVDGKIYYAPDIVYSKETDLDYDCKNRVPDEFLALFSKDDYRTEYIENGVVKHRKAFYTNVPKALNELEKVKNLTEGMDFYKQVIKFIPEDSIIVLNISEIINNPDLPRYVDLMDIIKRMSELKKA